MLDTHDLVDAHQSRQRAGDRHRYDNGPRRLDAPVHGGHLALTEDAQRIAPSRTPEIEPDETARDQREDGRQIDGRTADLPAERRERLVKLWQPCAGSELPRLRRLLARLDQHVD